MKSINLYFLLGIVCCTLSLFSCKHEPFLPIDIEPIDTTDVPIDTMMMGEPCDPDLIYFEYDILPILTSNCAFSGCHDAASAEDGVILTNYQSVIETADVEAYDLSGSDLYEVITEDDLDKRMPPVPNDALSQDQIALISTWILQGAKNLECDPGLDCDTTAVSFSATIKPLLENSCIGCHGGTVPSGGISFEMYSGVKAMADSGQLLGAVNWESGYKTMPQGGNKLPDCSIAQIRNWIEDGALNN